jgi:hypothetical protein
VQFNLSDGPIKVHRKTHHGQVIENFQPGIKTYRVHNNLNGVEGTFIFSKNNIKAILNIDNITYQLSSIFSHNSRAIYFISNVNNSPIKFDFICGNDLLNQDFNDTSHNNFRFSNPLGCVELAIEIDYYTFQSFENYQEAIDWALEIIAVASTFYLSEMGVELRSNFAQIWETSDPYSDFIQDANNMLFSIRDYWNSQDNLLDVNRHVVHLFSRRNDTGTGGIAFLNGVGSLWNGYGFSSGLTNEEEYVDLPVPYFFWNIYCLMHELGHNFGAKHTQWCGWPNGPIDNCVNIEEVTQGECAGYNNNPEPMVGTIMSYCHMWSAQYGGGIIIKFHETVKESLIAYMGLQDLNTCEEEIILGCLDEDACNYNLNATDSDDSCYYSEVFYDCEGNCLNDTDEDGVCDENVSLSILDNHNQSLFFPNPATSHMQIQIDNLYINVTLLQIINTLGQIVYVKDNIKPKEIIDISSVSAGVYTAC